MTAPIFGVQRLVYGDEWQWLNAAGVTTPHAYASTTYSRRDVRLAMEHQNKLHPGEKHRAARYYLRRAGW